MSVVPAPLWRFGDLLEPLRERVARGAVLAIPTESSYGLAVDPRNRRGVEAIFRLKGRDAGKPLPVLVAHRRQVADLGIDPDLPILSRLAACWPGAVTAVLPLAAGSRRLPAAAGGSTVAVRVPAHPQTRGLVALLGPLTATSANASGEPALVDPRQAARLLAGDDSLVIDGGVLPGGPPSTLVVPETDGDGQLRRVRVLREGRVSADLLAQLLGAPVVRGGSRDDGKGDGANGDAGLEEGA